MPRITPFLGSCLLLSSGFLLGQSAPPATNPYRATITAAPDTTILTSPLRPDGTVDYYAALNAKFSKGIDPKRNVFVALLKAIGTDKKTLGDMHAEIVKLAGAEESQGAWNPPPDNFHIADFLLGHVDLKDGWEARPWKAEKAPGTSQWIDSNAHFLDLLSKAAACDQYYIPLVPYKPGGTLQESVVIAVNSWKCAVRLLIARAMRSAGEGHTTAAWEDLWSAHRLSSFCERGPDLIQSLVGSGNEWEVLASELELLQQGSADHRLLQTILNDLQQLPSVPRANQIILETKQFEGLDAIQELMRLWNRQFDKQSLSTEQLESLAPYVNAFPLIDWNRVMRTYGSLINEYLANFDPKTLKEKRDVAHQWIDRISKLHTESGMFEEDNSSFSGERTHFDPHPRESKEAFSDRLAKGLFTILAPSFDKSEELLQKTQMKRALTILATALELYHFDHHAYPDGLAALKPAYLSDIPTDFYSHPLHYEHSVTGFYLASAGPRFDDLAAARARSREAIEVTVRYDLPVTPPPSSPTPPPATPSSPAAP